MNGKHVHIHAPATSGSYQFNYKGTFNFVFLAVVDVNCKFIFMDIGRSARISDGCVFKNSALSDALESKKIQITSECHLTGTDVTVPYVMVTEDAFPVKPYILKSYWQRGLSKELSIFNYRLSRV